MERWLYIPPLVLYAVLAFVHLLPGVWKWAEDRARELGGLGAFFHLIAVTLAVVMGRFEPGFPEALAAASLGMTLAWVWLASGRLKSLGLVLLPLAVVVLGTAMMVPHRAAPGVEVTGPSPWLPIHLGLMLAGVVGFALSCAVGVLYLVVRRRLKQRRLAGIRHLPALEVLDRFQFRSMLFGFLFLTLGIGAGGAWAAVSADEPWALDPLVAWTLVIWVWYGLALQVRLVAGWRGRWSALFSIVGFSGMIFSLVAMNFVAGGWHGYEG